MKLNYADTQRRAAVIQSARRIVIKVGTRLLTDSDGDSDGSRIGQLIAEIAGLRQRGMEIILVTSGAIGAGMRVLEITRRPVQLPRLQALAAVGQLRLMSFYEAAARQHQFHCGQVLLCADDLQDRERHLNTAFCIDTLLGGRVLPIINENDSVSVEEIKFGDNDRLAAMVAMLVRADLTILLTSVDGLHEMHNRTLGRRISLVSEFHHKLRVMALDTADRDSSVGGMASKLSAAETLAKAGEPTWIADGRDFSVLQRIFAGDDLGTLFVPGGNGRMSNRKRYLAFFSEPNGAIVIDAGAAQALTKPRGASLLARGVTDCQGGFVRGDTVRVLTTDGDEIARGVSNYSHPEVAMIKGLHSHEIKKLLGNTAGYDCVIHRNYLVLT